MKKLVKRVIRALFRLDCVYRLGRRIIFSLISANPHYEAVLRPSPSLYGAVIPTLFGTDRETVAALEDIPSETTVEERQFLYIFMASVWNGEGDILEVGPFLGGTTRALALGMMANPCWQGDNRLATYDRFKNYYDKKNLAEYLMPYIRSGLLQASVLELVDESASFFDVFRSFHEDKSYWNYLDAQSGILPATVESLGQEQPIFKSSQNNPLGVVFIDGCKSWFATKYFLGDVLQKTRGGCYFIFQDYGWFTCFWIPAIIWLLRESFRLIAYVDNTYAFQLIRITDSEELSRLIPDRVESIEVDTFARLFKELEEQAAARHDRRGVLIARLQHVAAIAYLGELEQAHELMRDIEQDAYLVAGFEGIMGKARTALTYYPDGSLVTLI